MLASVAKVDILLALLLRAQQEGRLLDRYERTLAARMIRYSDNDCAHELYLTIGGWRGLSETLHRLGVRHTRPNPACTGERRAATRRTRSWCWSGSPPGTDRCRRPTAATRWV